jgi:hypothetical protein
MHAKFSSIVHCSKLKQFIIGFFLSAYVYISLSTGWRVLKLGKATDWTPRSTAIGGIYFDDEN